VKQCTCVHVRLRAWRTHRHCDSN